MGGTLLIGFRLFFGSWEGLPIQLSRKEVRVNAAIRAPQVRVIGSDGVQLGIMGVKDALALASSQGLDLVEVAPQARPPVCKIIDYGKFKYEQKKKAQSARRRQAVASVKEVKFRPKTDRHDFEVKVANARRFLESGHKVKATVMFRGREMAHRQIGHDRLKQFAEALQDVGTVVQAPRMEGRTMTMFLAPSS